MQTSKRSATVDRLPVMSDRDRRSATTPRARRDRPTGPFTETRGSACGSPWWRGSAARRPARNRRSPQPRSPVNRSVRVRRGAARARRRYPDQNRIRNSALQVDLYAQANADRAHGIIYSGFRRADRLGGRRPGTHRAAGRSSPCPPGTPKADMSTVVPAWPVRSPPSRTATSSANRAPRPSRATTPVNRRSTTSPTPTPASATNSPKRASISVSRCGHRPEVDTPLRAVLKGCVLAPVDQVTSGRLHHEEDVGDV